MVANHTFSLESKYREEAGTVLLTGIQALVRLPLDQHRADKRRGRNTATLISGYRGSPVGGIDLTLARHQALLKEHQVVFIPGVNEELGATAIFGSQLSNIFPEPKFDGVLGMWYGKGPGVDRSGDIFKHANIAGVGRYGGVLALAGDDPTAKSSTIPSHSEVALYDALMPVLYPGNVQDVLDLGRLGFELSRYSGLWVGFKIVTNVADGFGTALVSPDRIPVIDPGFTFDEKPWQHTQNPALLAPYSLMQEREIHEGRLEAAKAFAATNGINQIAATTPDDWLGIIAAGKTYYDLREALTQIGLDEVGLRQHGIRLLKLGMIFPLEPAILNQFADGLEEILVIEEKRAFVELFVRDLLYHRPERPRVVGKRDEQERMLVRSDGELDPDQIAQILAQRLKQRLSLESIEARIERLRKPPEPLSIPILSRTPYFCSGCSHNRSTLLPEGSIANAGIGCHTLALGMDRNTFGVTQMGGEGAQWVGASPFSHLPHIFQNLGDGTLFHSGSLAIRQSVASGTNITYKILYNSAVGMTGGQDADGAIAVPELTQELQAEGVREIIVLSDYPDKYSLDVRWANGVEVWHRDRLDEAQRKLRDIPGVTALIYDQYCMAELRRRRRRGLAPEPPMRVFINEAVCEGCGDCGVKSNCLSVFPVETEFGRKTRIHQSSCNKDYSCLDGDCPAFITVLPAKNGSKQQRKHFVVEVDLSAPVFRVNGQANIAMMGIGGTGVVTTNQIIGTAALLDGKHVEGLDQTGLSQKGGPVVANLKIMDTPQPVSSMVMTGDADCYLVFDLLTGTAPKNLARASADKTTAIVSTSKIPTGKMVSSIDTGFPEANGLLRAIDNVTRKEDNIYFDAIGLAESLFGNHLAANLIAVGAAYQTGVLPVSVESMEKAIKLNGVAVEMNIQAFRVGRRLVADPNWASSLESEETNTFGSKEMTRELSADAQILVDSVAAPGELQRLLEIRVPELIAYQDAGYAREYVDFVRRVRDKEQRAVSGETRLSENVARYLFKLMAYKDEYEVARLHLKAEVSEALAAQFGKQAKVSYRLHPPFLRLLGFSKKIELGRWFDVVYRLLVLMHRLRGTPFDVFGYTNVRRTERALIGQYRALIEQALGELTQDNYELAVKLASLPDIIRGYEDIKLANVDRFWDEVGQLGYASSGTRTISPAMSSAGD